MSLQSKVSASSGPGRSSHMLKSMNSSLVGRSSMANKPHDPYDLDFREIRHQYAHTVQHKLPFVKSSFVHYAGCPLSLEIDDIEYKDELAITMELV